MMDFLNIQDAKVQQFLWDYVVPSDIRWDYSMLDALRHIQDEVVAGRQWLIGDMEAGLVFRVVVRNPHCVEPHIMGNVMRLRSLLPSALELGFSRGIKSVLIWTSNQKIASIVERLNWGFVRHKPIPAMHFDGIQLLAMHVVSLERANYAPT